MQKENIQKELFEFEAPKKQRNRLGQFFQKTDFSANLNAEKLIFVSIGILMILVISFALGVERGKAISGMPIRIADPLPKALQIDAASAPVISKPVAARPAQASAMVAQSAPDYTVVAAAFSKESSAIKEMARLKKNGLEAFVYNSDPYYLVCSGSFIDKESAQKTLKRVRQLYRDAYVKLK